MGSVRTRMIRATTTTVLLLLLQAAAYHQASVPTHANTVLTDAALSLKESLALDYDVLPMFKDITFMMESLVELMPYLEEAVMLAWRICERSLIWWQGHLNHKTLLKKEWIHFLSLPINFQCVPSATLMWTFRKPACLNRLYVFRTQRHRMTVSSLVFSKWIGKSCLLAGSGVGVSR